MPEQPDRLRLLRDQFTANAVQAARAVRADRSDETRQAHHEVAAVWTQAAHLLNQTIKQAGGTRTTENNPPTSAFPDVQGRCPACHGQSLFLGSGGYITCARLECPEPDAASTLLNA
jgi:hypothetical protein